MVDGEDIIKTFMIWTKNQTTSSKSIFHGLCTMCKVRWKPMIWTWWKVDLSLQLMHRRQLIHSKKLRRFPLVRKTEAGYQTEKNKEDRSLSLVICSTLEIGVFRTQGIQDSYIYIDGVIHHIVTALYSNTTSQVRAYG